MFCLKETQDLLANNYVPGQTEPLYMILYVHKELTDALEIAYIGNQFVSNFKDQTRLSRFGRFKITGILLVRKRPYMDIYCCKYMLNSSVL